MQLAAAGPAHWGPSSSRGLRDAGRRSVTAAFVGARARVRWTAGGRALRADPSAADCAAAAAASAWQSPLGSSGSRSPLACRHHQHHHHHHQHARLSLRTGSIPSTRTITAPTNTPSSRTSSSAANCNGSSSPNTVQVVDALVIGSGPAGLATALMLQRRGWARIVVLDQQPSVEQSDPTKSYVYAIDGRGRKALDKFDLSDQLQHSGLLLKDVLQVPVSGPAKTVTPWGPNPDPAQQLLCIPRDTFLQLLLSAIKAAGSAIQVLPSSTFVSFSRAGAGSGAGADGPLRVHALVQGAKVTYEPTLLVGADGVQSIVRRKLAEADASGSRFKMHKVASPAAGLQVRGILLPPNPALLGDPSTHSLPNHQLARLSGKNKLLMVMFPTNDPDRPRIATIVQKHSHPLWSIRDPKELYSLLESSFPQIPLRQLLSQQAAEAFVSSSGVTFPRPQYCPNMQTLVWSPASWSEPSIGSGSGSGSASASASGSEPAAGKATASRPTEQQRQHRLEQRQGLGTAAGASSMEGPQRLQAVLLVGDAVHCFPPDLGQGVNCALEDVGLLDQALSECGGRLDLALPLYEQRRLPDIKALIRICQFGNPYQYDQDRAGKAMWVLNILMRRTLNKLVPWLVSPPAVSMLRDASLSYSQVLQRADATTRTLWMLAGAAVLLAVLLISGRTA